MDSINNKADSKKEAILVMIYRQHYPDRIAQVENLYGKRFSRIHHLIPCYEEQHGVNSQNKNLNIIPVYDSYHYHQSFIAKGLSQYYSKDASHYIFITDDFVLEPEINEDNYETSFKLKADSAFITKLANMDNAYSLLPWKYHVFFHLKQMAKKGKKKKNPVLIDYLKAALMTGRAKQWQHSVDAYNFSLHTKEIKWPAQLVNHIEAMQRFKQNNLSIDHIDIKKAVRRHKKGRLARHPAIKKSMLFRATLEYWLRGEDSYRPYKLAYPLARGNSNIFIIPNSAIHRFATHCGIFATYKLFYEIAIPTSVILTTDNIVQVP